MPGKPIPPQNQIVAAAFTAAFFIGIYFSTFLQSLRGLLFGHKNWELRPANSIQWPILIVSLCIFTLACVTHVTQVHSWMQESLMTPPASRLTNWIDITICTTSNFTAQLTDAVLVFRLWKVYNNSYRVIALPVILWIGGLVLTALQIYLQVVNVTEFKVWLPVNVDMGPGIILTPFWASTILLNLYATSMIIHWLWKFKQESVFGHTTQAIEFAASLIIESGALYLVPAISHFVVWWTPNDFAISIISNINIPVLGIAFNLTIIRLSNHRAHERGTMTRVTEIQFQHDNTVKTEDIEETRSSDLAA